MSEELTFDQALEQLNGVHAEPIEEEQQQEEVIEQPEQTDSEPTEQPEEQQEEAKVEQPTVDFTAKVKFKANGQEVEKSIQELINDAQLASNYNTKMQELAQQRKAFEASLQQPQQPDPAKQLEDLNNKVTQIAMQMLGIKDPEEFVPDATGIMGNKAHFAAYQKALLDIQMEEQSVQHQQREYEAVEQSYYDFANTHEADPNAQAIYDHAVNAIFALPQKGKEGIAEFQEMYGIYQKVQQREQYWADMQRFGQSTQRVQPFTRQEVEKLTKFYNSCKAEYQNKQTKEQVKAQVPKSVPIKPTVKVESTTGDEPAPKQKVDFKKLQSMDIDDIAKLL